MTVQLKYHTSPTVVSTSQVVGVSQYVPRATRYDDPEEMPIELEVRVLFGSCCECDCQN